MFNASLGLYIGLCSYNRPQNVQPMYDVLGTDEFTWYVRNKEQAKLYADAGAKHIKVSVGYPDGRSGDLVRKRNEIQDDAFALGHWAFLLSDDLKGIQRVVEDPSATGGKGGGLKTEPWDFVGAVTHCKEMMEYFPEYMMCGIQPVCNLFYCHHVVSTNLFCIGDWLIVKPNPLRMDERIVLKHDYDLTAKHVKEYGGVVRCDYVFALFEHYKGASAGGCDTRNYELEDSDIRYLLENHPGMFRMHNTRQHEVLTKFVATRPSIETFKEEPHYIAYKRANGGQEPVYEKGDRSVAARIEKKKENIAWYENREKVLTEKLEETRGKLAKEREDLVRLEEEQKRVSFFTPRTQATNPAITYFARPLFDPISGKPYPPLLDPTIRVVGEPEQRADFDINDPYGELTVATK